MVMDGQDTHRVRGRKRDSIILTARQPTFHVPQADVNRSLLRPAGGGSFCEWKGPAQCWDLVDGARRAAQFAWR
jgi:uncharacterized protein (DUF427 family)